jgi:hypothetical protein
MQTTGSVIDQLNIVNIKIWHWIEKETDKSLSDRERLEASDKVVDLNKQRNYLIDELDEMINNAIKIGGTSIFFKNKLYEDN